MDSRDPRKNPSETNQSNCNSLILCSIDTKNHTPAMIFTLEKKNVNYYVYQSELNNPTVNKSLHCLLFSYGSGQFPPELTKQNPMQFKDCLNIYLSQHETARFIGEPAQ